MRENNNKNVLTDVAKLVSPPTPRKVVEFLLLLFLFMALTARARTDRAWDAVGGRG